LVFSSPIFLFYFFPLVLLFYFLFPAKNLFLLLAGLFFYAWGETHYVLILLISIGLNYLSGILIGNTTEGNRRKIFLWVGLSLNLILLVFFKYVNFFAANFNQILHWMRLPAIAVEPVHLPLGISFFTFQAMSYLIDVYRKNNEAVRNPLDLGLYISMFPQLVAGPIVRFGDIADQIKKREVTPSDFTCGIRRFVVGLAQKMLIANILAVPADAVFAVPHQSLTTSLAWLGTISYTLQIYFDFSGYSNMAIGLGLMFGFRFPENFNFPYISKSITEFWRRWHISLSSWFRDYLYIPLGGNRQGVLRTYINLIIVFFLCGLWHGADWTFVIWGFYHGLFIVIERMGLGRWLKRLWSPLAHFYTMIIICVGWVWFRSESVDQAILMTTALFGRSGRYNMIYDINQFLTQEVLFVLPIAVMFSIPLISGFQFLTNIPAIKKFPVKLFPLKKRLVYGLEALTVLVIMFLVGYQLAAQTHNPFIYFRF
jgi:alginate O-acetyltransferase complex protein AlgI